MRVPQKEVALRNCITNDEWKVQPPDIQIAGNSNYEVDYLQSMSKSKNVYCKKPTDLTVVHDVLPNRLAIGRPENDVTSALADSIERNTSLFASKIETKGSDSVARSLLRQRSIRSMIKNSSRAIASRVDSSQR